MRVFVAGATGAIGRQLVPRLVVAGHEVHGMTRSESKQAMLHELGAVLVVADALEPDQVAEAVATARPDVIVHQLTAIGTLDTRHMERDFAPTNRLRTEGTDHLVSAAQAVGVQRFVAQSNVALYARTGAAVKSEDDPHDPAPVPQMRPNLEGMVHLEQTVLGARGMEGIVLRYGWFYGPGTGITRGGEVPELIRKRKFRWSATAKPCGRSSTSRTPRRRRWRRSSTAVAASTTSSTTIPPRSPSGCRPWLGRWAPISRCACRDSSGGSPPARRAS
jgi:nucleoside-diphosphate-sugar epimerase